MINLWMIISACLPALIVYFIFERKMRRMDNQLTAIRQSTEELTHDLTESRAQLSAAVKQISEAQRFVTRSGGGIGR